MKKINAYTDEDFIIDLDWLEGYGIENEEASKFINHLLDSRRARELEQDAKKSQRFAEFLEQSEKKFNKAVNAREVAEKI